MRIAVVTARAAVGLDDDEPLLLAALARVGAGADVTIWDDDEVDWSSYDVAVIRSTWDYASRHQEFLAWAARASGLTRLVNPVEVLSWNTDKTYLRELGRRGVPVVPTTWIAPGRPVELPHAELVVKPTVSAGSRDTARYASSERAAAQAHVAALIAAGRTAMAQPYVRSVDEHGETALLFIGGRFTHAVRKGPLLRIGEGPTQDLFAAEEIQPVSVTAPQREVADAVLQALPFDRELAYARVDLVADDDGAPLLLEVELAEPSLFLQHHPPAADRLAQVLAQ